VNTKNVRPLRFASALLGLSVALVSGANADDFGRGPRVVQTANAIDLTQGQIPTASAGVLVRSPSGIEERLSMTGLTPFNAYTIYWMIYNRPENCAIQTFCNPVDLTDATGAPDPQKIKAVGGTVFVGSGFIASGDGTANVTLSLKDGPLPIGDPAAVPPLAGFLWPGNGLHAFIITIIRTHGPAVTGKVATQISQPEAGCGVCFDQQAIIFGTAPISN
jgi:hypothetical protein